MDLFTPATDRAQHCDAYLIDTSRSVRPLRLEALTPAETVIEVSDTLREAAPFDNLDLVRKARILHRFTRDGGVRRIKLDRNQLTILWQGTSKPDGRIAAQRANLEDALCANHLGQQVDQLALAG